MTVQVGSILNTKLCKTTIVIHQDIVIFLNSGGACITARLRTHLLIYKLPSKPSDVLVGLVIVTNMCPSLIMDSCYCFCVTILDKGSIIIP